MKDLKPYLIKAINAWVNDNALTPYLMVDAEVPNTIVPTDFITEGKIILNLRPSAINNLTIGNDSLSFNASFNGQSMNVFVPINAVIGIYAQENGKGMFFDPSEDNDNKPQEPPQKTSPLRLVK
ncbi:MAG: ClpXP protease specificity-enhancing factor [Methylococcales bacterium]|jgi:stringent starvation protein B|nr:ClpXP protease specificity-enhancing factor [Methylococcaceae bacterium]HIL40649.1 ClpXP protease specificity-enhancing factor [Methylococcales bacterium]